MSALIPSSKTATTIANLALTHVEHGLITSIDQANSRAARLCRENIGDAVEQAISAFDWNFASHRMTLAAVGDYTPPAYIIGGPALTAFALPDDCVRIREVLGQQSGWRVEGRHLLIEYTGALPVRYSRLIDDIAAWDVQARQAVGLYLGWIISGPLNTSINRKRELFEQYTAALPEAYRSDSQEAAPEGFNGSGSDYLQNARPWTEHR